MRALILMSGLISVAVAAPQGDAVRGGTVYMANCMACHGKDGAGDGPAARALKPPPRSFVTPEFWNGMTPERIGTTIRQGAKDTAMMGFPALTDQDVADLVSFIESKRPQP